MIDLLLPLIAQYPRLTVIAFALIISFLISLVNYFVLDKEKVRELKQKQKEIQARMKEHQKNGNTGKMMEAQKELLSQTGDMMKHSLKPMLITIVPILILFSLIRSWYAETAISGSWFWYYLVSALVSSMVFRKLFKLP